jgi:hypothetical protein
MSMDGLVGCLIVVRTELITRQVYDLGSGHLNDLGISVGADTA